MANKDIFLKAQIINLKLNVLFNGNFQTDMPNIYFLLILNYIKISNIPKKAS